VVRSGLARKYLIGLGRKGSTGSNGRAYSRVIIVGDKEKSFLRVVVTKVFFFVTDEEAK
jgi:hypothetical protein